ncbi:MAG TPA: ABC transporter ATP-binding protein [Devosiaceae bacterium]|jgi:oligopeptide/dipeptide ABC transporter ATP-binding protein
MTTAAGDLLRVEDLNVRFGSAPIVDRISFTVGHGEAVGLVGESGSGKSMTALSLLRLVPEPGRITGGRIAFEGRDLNAMSAREMRAVRLSEIGMIFQDASSYLNPIMTIGEQIAEAIGQRRSRSRATHDNVIEVLKAVQIADPERVAASYPYELSGGMQQRAMIASVLIRHPSLIVADEPTTALDATVQHQILKFLAAMRAELNVALILISHDLAVISQVCDRVYIMYGGQLVEQGATKALFDDPKHPYTVALIASILDPFDPKSSIVALEGSPPDMRTPPSGCRFHPRCPHAFDKCMTEEPPDFHFPSGQTAKCWLHQGQAQG